MDFDRIYMSGMQKLAEFSARHKEAYGNVLMFHQVFDNKESWLFPEFSMTKADFCLMLEKLSQTGIKFISVNELEESVKQSEKFCCITFDDGFEDTYSQAYPLLKERGIPFTVFVTTGFLGKERYLSREQLKEISADPLCTIGSHTATHPMIRKIGSEQKQHEFSDSKKLLEDITGKRVDYFAYPYGSYLACGSEGDTDSLKKAGYKAAFSTVNASVNKKTIANRYFLPRRNIGGADFALGLKSCDILR
jgi:peptidoglycan/xylan/chitin deacetylase (PgdA/CDA1 family)